MSNKEPITLNQARKELIEDEIKFLEILKHDYPNRDKLKGGERITYSHCLKAGVFIPNFTINCSKRAFMFIS